jgi:hypothetical protein
MIQASGEGGELVRSGRTIATLGQWDLHSDDEGLTITSKLAAWDGYWLPRTSCARVTLTIGKSQVRYAVFVTWDGDELRLTRGGENGD